MCILLVDQFRSAHLLFEYVEEGGQRRGYRNRGAIQVFPSSLKMPIVTSVSLEILYCSWHNADLINRLYLLDIPS